MLEEKAKKNVAKAEKKKEPRRSSHYSPGERKPSIASASKNSTKRSKKSADKSQDRKKSVASSQPRNTPSVPDREFRPMSQELDRESQLSDPYKIMEN